jgi:inosine-uridine nucleoside N-ribohydrolase
MKKIIIDTDPGVDDALAIFLAIYAKLDVIALTTVFGNGTVLESTENALSLMNFLKQDIPVYKGENKPLQGEPTYAESHGKNALGGFSFGESQRKPEAIDAVSFIVSELKQNTNMKLICIGPLTNIAQAVSKAPNIVRNIGEIVILGGVFNEKGNITDYAEFNAFNDPMALKRVLDIRCRKILIPANVCRNVYFNKDDFSKVKNLSIKDTFQTISQEYIDYYQNDLEFGGFKGGVMYDLLAVSYLLNPNLFTIFPRYVEVCLKGERRGETIFGNGRSNVFVVTDVDARKLKQFFFDTINAV